MADEEEKINVEVDPKVDVNVDFEPIEQVHHDADSFDERLHNAMAGGSAAEKKADAEAREAAAAVKKADAAEREADAETRKADAEEREAGAFKKAFQSGSAGKSTAGGDFKKLGEGIAKGAGKAAAAAAHPYDTGKKVVGAGLSAGAGGAVRLAGFAKAKIGPDINACTSFLIIAFIFNLFDLIVLYPKFGVPTSPLGFFSFRMLAYVMLTIAAYFVLFGGKGDILKNFGFCFLVSALAFVAPLLLKIAPANQNVAFVLNIALTLLSPWLAYLIFGTPHFPKTRTFYIIIIILLALTYLILNFGVAFVSSDAITGQTNIFGAFMKLLIYIRDAFLKLFEMTKGVPADIGKGVQRAIKQATGDYYIGQVDQNTEEPLGVYIGDIKKTQPIYFAHSGGILVSGGVRSLSSLQVVKL